MHCGYVESCKTSLLVFQAFNNGYKSMKEAITELALDMYNKFHHECLSIYENRYSFGLKDCCRLALIEKHDANFCSNCGSQLKDKEFDPDYFMQFISELHNTDCDSYGESEYANGEAFSWYPFQTGAFIGAPKKSIIYIAEKAEVVLLCALFDAKPELKKLDYKNDDWLSFKKGKQPSYY